MRSVFTATLRVSARPERKTEELTLQIAVDNLHNTAGDIALSLNNEKCYTIIRDAGIRSGTLILGPHACATRWRGANDVHLCYTELVLRLLAKHSSGAASPLNLILKATDDTPAGSTDAFLSTKLQYTKDEHGQDICLVKVNDKEEVGVMMGWERDISEFCDAPLR